MNEQREKESAGKPNNVELEQIDTNQAYHYFRILVGLEEFSRRRDELLAPYGLVFNDLRVFAAIAEHNPATLKSIHHATGISRSTVHYCIKRLVTHGWVNKDDRDERVLRATEQGREFSALALAKYTKILRPIYEQHGMDPEAIVPLVFTSAFEEGESSFGADLINEQAETLVMLLLNKPQNYNRK